MGLVKKDELHFQTRMSFQRSRMKLKVPTKRYPLVSVHYKASEMKKVGKCSFFLVIRKTNKYKTLVVEGTSFMEEKLLNREGNERVGQQ
jgi:hypothetical protein